MPVSDKFHCLFIHIPKTGGTSIETALQMRGDRLREHRNLLYGPIQSRWIRRKNPRTRYLQHLTFEEVRKIAPEVSAGGYFSFAFVRNPWDRMVSLYNNLDGNLVRTAKGEGLELQGLSFAEFLERTKDRFHAHLRPQCEFICAKGGSPQVDFLGRFESLEEDFDKICHHLGVNVHLPWHNKAAGKPRDCYRDYYCSRTRDIIEERYRKDIELFGYRF